jgi:hypothetical protein
MRLDVSARGFYDQLHDLLQFEYIADFRQALATL